MYGEGFLALLGTWRNLEAPCLLVVVYAPQDHHEKQILWNNLSQLIANYNNFSILLGDFNEVIFQSDRIGIVFDSGSASKFNNFIHYSGLSDLPLGGKRFTRMNNLGSKHKSWVSSTSGPPAVVFKTKLKRLKNTIKQWRANVQQSESKSCCELRAKIDCLDNKAEISPLSPYEVDSRTSFLKQLADLEHHKVKDLKQKAKIRWAAKGDENSEENRSRPLFTSSRFQHLTTDEVHFLDRPFSLDEIKGAVWDCGSSKASGPDGLIPRGCNSSFITLVLKVDDPLVVGDFRQISLIGCQYKIIAKILANRLSQVVSSVVSDVQMAYIKGRQIIDGPLMVDDIIAWAKKHKRRLMFLKVDFEKAFDSLSWSFLFSVLEQMRFSSKWRNWIHSCLNSAFASVLVNGSPTNEFKIERGLRQGDPLSPFLFILAVEALNVALFEVTSNNIFHGIKVGKDKVHISHLQFADDALIMGEWSFTNAKNLSRILTCFQLAYGLKVNFNKSKLYGVGVSNSELNSLAATIGCLASQFPCIYLGLPIGAKMTRCRNWNPLAWAFTISPPLKPRKRLLASLKALEEISFGAGVQMIKKIPWISWDKVIATRDFGGLGIGSLKIYNQTMLTKWWWRFYTEDNALWNKVVCSIYGPTGGLHYNSLLKPNSGPWYHIMKLKDDLLAQGVDLPSLFRKKIGNGECTSFWHDKWMGGQPLCTSFPRLYRLESNQNCFVCDRSPTVRNSVGTDAGSIIASASKTFGSDPMGLNNPPGLSFRWVWCREVCYTPELEELNNLISLLSHLHLSVDEDTLEYTIDTSRKFTVKGMRIHITSVQNFENSMPTRWNQAAPSKVNINTWRVMNRRMPTRTNLDHRGLQLTYGNKFLNGGKFLMSQLTPSWTEVCYTPELEELNNLISLLSHIHLSVDEDTWEYTIDTSRKFTVKGMRIHITSVQNFENSMPTRWNQAARKSTQTLESDESKNAH
ncbi:putative RNA-directed DNA polymerase [Tanacetum coccineum]